MRPLTIIENGETVKVEKVGGLEETKRFLINLGFTEGAEITVVNQIDGNMIVKIRDARVAINTDMAKKIKVL